MKDWKEFSVYLLHFAHLIFFRIVLLTIKYPLLLHHHANMDSQVNQNGAKTRYHFGVTKITIFGRDNSFIRRVISNDLPRERDGFVNLDSSIKRGGMFSRGEGRRRCRASFRQIYLGPVDGGWSRSQESTDETRKEISWRRGKENIGGAMRRESSNDCPSRMKISQRAEKSFDPFLSSSSE